MRPMTPCVEVKGSCKLVTTQLNRSQLSAERWNIQLNALRRYPSSYHLDDSEHLKEIADLTAHLLEVSDDLDI